MKNNIIILASDTDSINYEILKKSIFFFKKIRKNNYTLIGCKKKLKINENKYKSLNFINVDSNNKKYLNKGFKLAFKMLREKKANGLINLPLNKKKFLKNKYPGVTEFISKSFNILGKETMLLYNKSVSVSPVTTHVKVRDISKSITKKKIINNVININNFYKNILKIKKPKIAILGLNPHCGIDFDDKIEENSIIIPIIKKYKNLIGPLSADTAFLDIKKKKINSIIGMYHDQVLPTFKYISKFNGINITLGLPFLRVSPDHGTAKNLIGANKADTSSFIYSLIFFEENSKNI